MSPTRLFTALATCTLLASLPAQAQECAALADVKGGQLPDGRVAIPVTVEDRALYFLLDTGGIATTIKWELARAMKLPATQAVRPLNGVGGAVLNFVVTGEHFSIGGLKVDNKPIYLETRPLRLDGTLSADILNDYDVEIDLTRYRMKLMASGDCAPPAGASAVAIDVAPYGSHKGHIRFPVKIDGLTVMATLDTGATSSVIGMRAAAALGVYPASPKLDPLRRRGNDRLYAYPFGTLQIGEVTVPSPRITVASDGFLPGENNDLVLGIDALAGLKLTIAYGHNRLYIVRPEGN
jgi:predicted aspartyl protease